MAIKIKKKVDPEISESNDEKKGFAGGLPFTDDQLFGVSHTLFDYISDNRGMILSFVGVAVVALIVWGQFSKSKKATEQAHSIELYEVLHVDMAEIGEGTDFESLSERATAVILAAEMVSSPDLVDEAALISASSSLLIGDIEPARQGYDSYLASSNTGLAEIMIASLGVATAQAAAGNLDVALELLSELESRSSYFAFDVALMRASLIDTFSEDVNETLVAYRQLRAAYPESGDATLDTRISQLEIEIGDDPENASPENEHVEDNEE